MAEAYRKPERKKNGMGRIAIKANRADIAPIVIYCWLTYIEVKLCAR